MPTERILRGVAHDLAHHAQSALGWLHPHLGQACREAGGRETTVKLLAPEPYPNGLPDREPLRLALAAMRGWFIDLLSRLGCDAASIEPATLDFRCRANDDYDSAVRVSLTTRRGKTYTVTSGFFGGGPSWPLQR